MFRKSSRLQCSATADVSSLMEVVEGFLAGSGTRDLDGLLKDRSLPSVLCHLASIGFRFCLRVRAQSEDIKSHNTWKTAPKVQSLVQYSEFMCAIVKKALVAPSVSHFTSNVDVQ